MSPSSTTMVGGASATQTAPPAREPGQLPHPTDLTSPFVSSSDLPSDDDLTGTPVFQDGESPHDWYCQAKELEVLDRVEEAMELFVKAAVEGHLAAMVSYGLLLVATDERAAFDWLRNAADRGNPRAWYHLGQLFARGGLFSISPTDAARCWHRAAQLGDSAGRSALGLCYIRGFGVKQNITKGVAIVKQVANVNDDVTAMKNLAWVFRHGKGVKADPDEADYWQEKAKKRDELLEGANAMWSNWKLPPI